MATLTKQNRIKVITVSLFTSILVPLTCLAEPEIVGLEEANNGSILEIIAEMLRPLNYIFYRLKYVYIFPGVSIFDMFIAMIVLTLITKLIIVPIAKKSNGKEGSGDD